ncbi:hypothetical protein O1E30_002389 [Enterococcus hirae]|nr:hypothetical protein [Enterococcus hirae]
MAPPARATKPVIQAAHTNGTARQAAAHVGAMMLATARLIPKTIARQAAFSAIPRAYFK